MNEFKIFEDKEAIATDKAKAKEMEGTMNSLYQLFKEKGFNPTPDNLTDFVKEALINGGTMDFYTLVDNSLRGYIVDNNSTGAQNFGFPVNREKLKELIDVPEDVVKQTSRLLSSTALDLEVKELLIFNQKAEQFELIDGYEKAIIKRHTYYARTKESIEAAKTLLVLVDALNNYKEKCNIDSPLRNIEGVKFDDKYRIDTWFARNMVATLENK